MGHPYYFQFTLTPYNSKIETGLTDKRRILESFIDLSQKIGREKVVWRYDPIFITPKMTVEFHLEAFSRMIDVIGEHTERCIFSFLDTYKKVGSGPEGRFEDVSESDMRKLASGFADIAKPAGVELHTCAESIDLDEFGIGHASCIDGGLIERITGMKLLSGVKKDAQREGCGCIECIDIGEYDTCLNGCLYCYATRNHKKSVERHALHDPESELLIGRLNDDKVNERKVRSLLDRQLSL